jgi:hypothetical protein
MVPMRCARSTSGEAMRLPQYQLIGISTASTSRPSPSPCQMVSMNQGWNTDLA